MFNFEQRDFLKYAAENVGAGLRRVFLTH